MDKDREAKEGTGKGKETKKLSAEELEKRVAPIGGAPHDRGKEPLPDPK